MLHVVHRFSRGGECLQNAVSVFCLELFGLG